MKLFNTLTRGIDEVKPLKPPVITVYTCGPTVYDHAHIGHWFTYVRMDLLIRTLKANDLQTKWVMNITDVGHLTSDADEGIDKLEKKAQGEGKTAWEIAAIYTKEFLDSMTDLNILKPEFIVRATDHIDDQIDLIKRLEIKGYTYLIDDGVYFDTSKYPSYGDFAKLDLDEQEPGKRVSYNPQKRQPTDFALWKFSPKDHRRDMEWDSPWGRGFPGWHIECSAMSLKYLGDTLDIHTGGIDHIPIHHTNEIAQSESATGQRFVNHWLHSNHITINSQKISKSLGNGITLGQIKAQGYSAQVLRINVLESHYRSQSKFSWDSLASAKERLADLEAMAALRFQSKPLDNDSPTFAFGDVFEEILKLLNEDLNTPSIMAYLSDITSQMLAVGLESEKADDFNKMLSSLDQLLGLRLSEIKDISDPAKELISKREEHRIKSDWAAADKIRQELSSQGISLEDKPNGPQWRWMVHQ